MTLPVPVPALLQAPWEEFWSYLCLYLPRYKPQGENIVTLPVLVPTPLQAPWGDYCDPSCACTYPATSPRGRILILPLSVPAPLQAPWGEYCDLSCACTCSATSPMGRILWPFLRLYLPRYKPHRENIVTFPVPVPAPLQAPWGEDCDPSCAGPCPATSPGEGRWRARANRWSGRTCWSLDARAAPGPSSTWPCRTGSAGLRPPWCSGISRWSPRCLSLEGRKKTRFERQASRLLYLSPQRSYRKAKLIIINDNWKRRGLYSLRGN